jgi:glucosyl-3-phosphoglycerate synthase
MISVVIPAYNVESTIANVVQEMLSSPIVEEVIVADNNSVDKTAATARIAGAKVVFCEQQGMGAAIKEAVRHAKQELVLKIDGDIQNPSSKWCNMLIKCMGAETLFVNSVYNSDYDEFPVGTLVAKPVLTLLYPELSYVKIPLSGTYLFKKSRMQIETLPDNWSFDLALMMSAAEKGSRIEQVEIGLLNDRPKKIADYGEMALELLHFVIDRKYGRPI